MSRQNHGLSRLDSLMREHCERTDTSTPPLQSFGYLLPSSKTKAGTGPNELTGDMTDEQLFKAFDALVETMRTSKVSDGPADAGMTFFGQFIDHDITLDATSMIGKKIDPRSIRNVRTPTLDLDCVYGDGPDASPHLYHPDHDGFLLFGRPENPNDLARNFHDTALIGDPRNDENIIVSQIQGAFITLHNILMSKAQTKKKVKKVVHSCGAIIRKNVWETMVKPESVSFEEVRLFVRHHYQHLVLTEFLPAFVDQASIDLAMETEIFGDDAPVMPVEFSGSVFRFGHATVQPKYQLTKSNRTKIGLFEGIRGFKPRTPDDDIEMQLFFSVSDKKSQKALPIGTKMADTLFELPEPIVKKGETFGDFTVKLAKARSLGLRNILRDRGALRCASGQQIARWLSAQYPDLDIEELRAPKVLREHGISKTPLWFYCLEEAERHGNGKLTGVGGAVVASTIVRLLKLDNESVLHNPNFKPWSGFGKDYSMGKLMTWIEDHRDDVSVAKDLRCG